MKKLFLASFVYLLVLVGVGHTSSLGWTDAATITDIQMYQGDGTVDHPPAIRAMIGSNAFGTRIDTDRGKQIYTLLLTAFTTGQKIRVWGNTTNTEAVAQISYWYQSPTDIWREVKVPKIFELLIQN